MTDKFNNLKVALVAEELTQLGGAERVLDALLEIFPEAPIYTLVWNDKKTEYHYHNRDVRTSFIQKLPLGIRRYKWYLPLMPKAVESFDLSSYDLIISVTSALAKGVRKREDAIHICYCNTPTRYLWFDSADYIKNAPIPFFVRPLMPLIINRLRKWDLKISERPNYYIANSENVKNRIERYYHRNSEVLFPPVNANNIKPNDKADGEFYLIVSRIEPYKKVDLVIDAFKELGFPLKIVGSGTRLSQFKENLSSNIEIVGRVSDEKLAWYFQNAIATVFPQEEDAGIVPLESMAAGRPVIAYAKGGALESVIDGKTGVFFNEQTVEALIEAVKKFQQIEFDKQFIRQHAETFDKETFKQKFLEIITAKIA